MSCKNHSVFSLSCSWTLCFSGWTWLGLTLAHFFLSSSSLSGSIWSPRGKERAVKLSQHLVGWFGFGTPESQIMSSPIFGIGEPWDLTGFCVLLGSHRSRFLFLSLYWTLDFLGALEQVHCKDPVVIKIFKHLSRSRSGVSPRNLPLTSSDCHSFVCSRLS